MHVCLYSCALRLHVCVHMHIWGGGGGGVHSDMLGCFLLLPLSVWIWREGCIRIWEAVFSYCHFLFGFGGRGAGWGGGVHKDMGGCFLLLPLSVWIWREGCWVGGGGGVHKDMGGCFLLLPLSVPSKQSYSCGRELLHH